MKISFWMCNASLSILKNSCSWTYSVLVVWSKRDFMVGMITKLFSFQTIKTSWKHIRLLVLFFVLRFWDGIVDASSPFVLPQHHNSHTKTPSAEERGSYAVEAVMRLCPGGRMSELCTGVARGPLLPVSQVGLFQRVLTNRPPLEFLRKGQTRCKGNNF